jgi:hypothetical protein
MKVIESEDEAVFDQKTTADLTERTMELLFIFASSIGS